MLAADHDENDNENLSTLSDKQHTCTMLLVIRQGLATLDFFIVGLRDLLPLAIRLGQSTLTSLFMYI